MHAFDVLGDPVRRRILELLARGELRAGEIAQVIEREFKITHAAISQHLRVLRDAGFASVRVEGPCRIYALDVAPLQEIDTWLHPFRAFWTQKLDALETEIARGKKQRSSASRMTATGPSGTPREQRTSRERRRA